MTLREKPFKHIEGKGENAGNQHFLLFPQCFLPFPIQISSFHSHIFRLLHMLPIWTSLKICRLVKRYVPHDKILDLVTSKKFAEKNVTEILIYVFDRVENISEKGKMLLNLIFPFSYHVFNMLKTSPGSSKLRNMWCKVKPAKIYTIK